MSDADQNEKTEEATPEKRRRAREEGQFARSRDGGAVAASAAVVLSMLALGSSYVTIFRTFALHCFQQPNLLFSRDSLAVGHELGIAILWTILPGALAAAAGGIAVGLFEAGFNPQLNLIEFKLERLDPISRLKQLFSPTQAVQNVTLALLRVIVVGLVTYQVIKGAFPQLSRLAQADLSSGILLVLNVGLRLATWSTLVLVVLSAIDYGQSWFRTEKELMMTREELKEELHQQEGDPKVKARIRARARELARRGIAKEVKRSDVIIANPTHISIALRYRPAEGAPVVMAKGYDEVALYMRKLATENDIPIVENKPLARGLAAKVKVGKMIPLEFYQAVAEVLAFVYRMRGKKIVG